MLRRGYGISSFSNEMLKRHRENACLNEYFRVKSEIVQRIGQLNKGGHSHFCSKCDTIKKLIIAENEKVNNCYLRNSKSFKLIEDDDIKGFIAECIEYQTCVLNRTRPTKKTVTSGRASVGKAKQQLGGDSKTSKPGDSPIKGPQRQDQNRAGGKVLTEEKPIPQKPDGINASHNTGEEQAVATKQIANPPTSTSAIIETHEQTFSQSVHPLVSETDTRPSASIRGTPIGEDAPNKTSHAAHVSEDTSNNNILVGTVVDIEKSKNQDEDGKVAVTVTSGAGDISVVRAGPGVKTPIDREPCGAISDGKEPCETKDVMRASIPVSSSDMSAGIDGKDLRSPDEDAHGELSVDVSNDAEITLDEFICSE
ncbi:hypothetical protein PVC01_000060700 [Plasmodium vivax]|uniref:VIR protein n=1 Tax=Plasmodium vivax TaxID=5855 RepID=A0A1G4E7P5_PLAVI|nr:hypothetical protein PVC01_000060700 [Plasmodium vivax]